MNNNFSLKFKKIDIIFVVISLVISILFLFSMLQINNNQEGKRYLNVYHQNQRIKELYFDIDEKFSNLETNETSCEFILTKKQYPHLISDFHIEVDKEKGIRAFDIDCPDKDCEKMGWINIPNLEIICIPNDIRMYISIDSHSGGDIIL